MISEGIGKLYGSAIIGWTWLLNRGVEYLPPEKLQALRDRRLRDTVRFAAATVPYYRDLFQQLRIAATHIRTADDLDRLPLVDKETVQADPERFRSTSGVGRTALPFVTSGSTGRPLTVFLDRRSLIARRAFLKRHSEPLRAVLGRRGPYRTLFIGPSASNTLAIHSFVAQHRLNPWAWRGSGLAISLPLDDVIFAINQQRPEVLGGLGSYLEWLFRTLAARGTAIHLPRLVLYSGDGMSDEGKELIEGEFGVPVLSTYGAIEAYPLGFTCERRNGFHLHDDLNHVSIVDAQGCRLATGQSGEVVVSNLVNRGTVLLNYRLGDIAKLSADRCPCGRSLPLLQDLQGRTVEVFRLSNGRVLHPALLYEHFRHTSERYRSQVLQYQVIQRGLDVFELRLATVDRQTYDQVSGGIATALLELLGPGAAIEPVWYQDRLPLAPGGKVRPFVSLHGGPASLS